MSESTTTDEIESWLLFDEERWIEHDVAYGVHNLVDVALTALSLVPDLIVDAAPATKSSCWRERIVAARSRWFSARSIRCRISTASRRRCRSHPAGRRSRSTLR